MGVWGGKWSLQSQQQQQQSSIVVLFQAAVLLARRARMERWRMQGRLSTPEEGEGVMQLMCPFRAKNRRSKAVLHFCAQTPASGAVAGRVSN